MYKYHIETLEIRAKKGVVSDMSLLWLWWVSHHKNENNKYNCGNPYPVNPIMKFNTFPNAFNFAKKLLLPTNISNNIILCNGMDIVERTAFDHRHGFKFYTKGYKVDNILKIPYITGISLPNGGKPEKNTNLQ